MNIFATAECPRRAAIHLPDKHIVKMPLECCQMLAIVASKWYHNYGALPKSSGGHYQMEKGAFRNHPCTQWAAESLNNARWLIQHGLSLCDEYTFRYERRHACQNTLSIAEGLFPQGDKAAHTPFARAMPDIFKYDYQIDTIIAYQRYVSSKPWVATNYLRKPERKPNWVNSNE